MTLLTLRASEHLTIRPLDFLSQGGFRYKQVQEAEANQADD